MAVHFTLQTDHKPLLAIFGNKKGVPTYTANRLQRYDFLIQYVNTTNSGQADALSRLIASQQDTTEYVVIEKINSDIPYIPVCREEHSGDNREDCCSEQSRPRIKRMLARFRLLGRHKLGYRGKVRIMKRVGNVMYEFLTQDLLVWTRHANQLRPRQCDVIPPECPETIYLPFQNEDQLPRKQRIIPAITTPPVRTTSPHTEHRKSPPYRATRLRRAPTRFHIDPSRKTYDP
uniref:RT_RNaseH domain-containing protein n=1 Tax=Heterorhabditis bacteriophora TaxID=37862 RepID=A0A1I7XMX5_HETBA